MTSVRVESDATAVSKPAQLEAERGKALRRGKADAAGGPGDDGDAAGSECGMLHAG
jgi:hypothetical protein